MDGDISVDTEPGMGSQFTIRIPLYGSVPPARRWKWLDWLIPAAGWRCVMRHCPGIWKLCLSGRGITVKQYDGRTPVQPDTLITDDELSSPWTGRAVVTFCRRHIGIPLERAPGEWLHSVASPHDLLALLGRIYRVQVVEDQVDALPETVIEAARNDDMMILVVDDHPINRRLLADQLGSLGYQCKTANDGVDALNVLSKNHIDIVLSDVNMPNMDGYRLTQRIRQLGLTLPVIGVTANALAEETQRCLESGMDSCLSKPVTLDVIRQTLAAYATRVRNNRR